jgi:hypothetical protein
VCVCVCNNTTCSSLQTLQINSKMITCKYMYLFFWTKRYANDTQTIRKRYANDTQTPRISSLNWWAKWRLTWSIMFNDLGYVILIRFRVVLICYRIVYIYILINVNLLENGQSWLYHNDTFVYRFVRFVYRFNFCTISLQGVRRQLIRGRDPEPCLSRWEVHRVAARFLHAITPEV